MKYLNRNIRPGRTTFFESKKNRLSHFLRVSSRVVLELESHYRIYCVRGNLGLISRRYTKPFFSFSERFIFVGEIQLIFSPTNLSIFLVGNKKKVYHNEQNTNFSSAHFQHTYRHTPNLSSTPTNHRIHHSSQCHHREFKPQRIFSHDVVHNSTRVYAQTHTKLILCKRVLCARQDRGWLFNLAYVLFDSWTLRSSVARMTNEINASCGPKDMVKGGGGVASKAKRGLKGDRRELLY